MTEGPTAAVARILVCCVFTSALGCRGPAASTDPPKVEGQLPTESLQTPPSENDEPLAQSEATDAIQDLDELGSAQRAEAPAVAEFEKIAQPAAPPRDLGAELKAAIGSPVDCLRDYRPAGAMTIRVDLSAVVRESGMVIEPNASGGGLSANDLRCVEQRAGGVTLSPLSGAASERVTTVVTIDYQAPQVEEYDVGVPTPKLEDVVQPLPKKKPIPPSGKPIEGPAPERIDGPSGVPIEGPSGVPIEGPEPKPIEGY